MLTRRRFAATSVLTLLARRALAQSATVQAGPAQEVSIAVSSTSFVIGGVKLGEKAGLFAKNGLGLHLIVMDSGSAAMSALIGGSVPFSVAGPPEVLAARARGQRVAIVANLYAGLAGSVVLAKSVADKLGVAPSAPVDARLRALDGLLLAEPSATSSLLGPIRAATEAVDAHVRFTYMAQGAMPAALENGAIQGMVASFPFAGTPIVRGTGVLWIDGPGGELPASVLPASSSVVQTTESLLKSQPDLIHRVQKTVVEIADYIKTDPQAAKRDLAASYPQLSPAEIDLAWTAQWRNWTKPFLTDADIVQESKLLKQSVKLPGLDAIKPMDILVAPS